MKRNGKIGVLLVNLGTPDEPSRWSVYKYLKQFLLDKRVIDIPWLNRQILVRGIIAPFRSKSSAEEYKKVWTEDGSPLLVYGKYIRKRVQEILGSTYVVSLGMRYQSPSMERAIEELLSEGVRKIVVFPMFPQYASATTGSVMEEVMRVLSKEQNIPEIHLISQYPALEEMIDIWVDKGYAMDVHSYDHILLSFHGLPERQIFKADRHHICQLNECCDSMNDLNHLCYRAQCYATAKAIIKKLQWDENKWDMVFQSRLGKEPWLKPYTDQKVEELKRQGVKKILVFCPAFVADCLETTIEIGEVLKQAFETSNDMELNYVESLNDDERWVMAITRLIREKKLMYEV